MITPDLNYDGFARRRLYLSYLACLLYDGTGYFRSTFDRAHYPHCVTDRPTDRPSSSSGEKRRNGRTDGKERKDSLPAADPKMEALRPPQPQPPLSPPPPAAKRLLGQIFPNGELARRKPFRLRERRRVGSHVFVSDRPSREARKASGDFLMYIYFLSMALLLSSF